MTGAPVVSVVIPTYNRARVVPRAILSVLGQTLADLEVLVVDDGSTDETSQAVGAIDDPRVRPIALHANAGASRARNEGIRAARADLVAFLDSDDEWLPGKLDRQLAHYRDARDPERTVVYCGWSKPGEPFDPRRPLAGDIYHEGDVTEPLIDGWTPGASSFLVPRRSLLAVGGFDEALPAWNDYDLWLRLARAGHRFLAVKERLRIKHDFEGPQLTTDPVARLAAFQALEQKWRDVICGLRGEAGFQRWSAWGYASVQHAWLRRMEATAARGDRAGVWRGYLGMWRGARRSRSGLLRGLVLAIVGPAAYGGLRDRRRGVASRISERHRGR